MTASDLESEVLKLDPKERARIAQRLLESLEALSENEIESLWYQEAERRDQALDEDRSEPRDSCRRGDAGSPGPRSVSFTVS